MIQPLEQYSIEDLLAALAVKQNAAPNAANEHEQQQAIRDQQAQAWERLAKRPSINLPTPENLQAVTDKAAAQRVQETQAQNNSPHFLGRRWGVSHELALFLQRMEATIIEQGRRIAQLEAAEKSTLPRHMRDVEMRG